MYSKSEKHVQSEQGNPNLFAVEQRVFILHADERGPPVLACDLVEMRKLPATHRARANVAHFTALDKVVQGFHRLFGRHIGVKSVDLEEIEVGCLQTRKRGVDGVEDGRAGKTTLVDVLRLVVEIRLDVSMNAGVVGNERKAFRCDHDLVTGDLILGKSEVKWRHEYIGITFWMNLAITRSDPPLE